MKKFQVGLTRTYLIEVEAENPSAARWACEFYLGDPTDLSQSEDRVRSHFEILGSQMVYNEAALIEILPEELENETKITY